MNRLISITATAIVSAALVAGCGGGGKKQAVPTSGTTTGPGGTVNVEPTVGRLGGAETVLPGKVTVTGKPGPISPNASKPTQNQLKGVAARLSSMVVHDHPPERVRPPLTERDRVGRVDDELLPDERHGRQSST